MSTRTPFQSAHAIGDTDVHALPVREIAPAIGYYTQVMGFEVVSRDDKRAVLRRGEAEIGLEVNDADPTQASAYFNVADVEALRAEYEATGIEPGPFRIDEHGDGPYRVFFCKEPYGVCFCFGQKVQ